MALAVFLALLGFSALLAVSSHATTLSEAFHWGRSFGLLTFFYVIVRLFPEPAERRTLLSGAAILAAVTGVIALLVSMGVGFGTLVGVADAVKAEGEADPAGASRRDSPPATRSSGIARCRSPRARAPSG